ncbi:hypothetical protein [Pseudomonas putida]|uniref:hypothetical protein n=1 Tax=Pseudomonas putida TaxID=303 RepID=UPI000578EE56|nr:hypothetical protein [Pseudomonas putida]
MELFIDHTDFEPGNDPWNGWQKGPNGSLLMIKTEQGNHFAGFENFQGTLNGRILNKTLEGLTPATHYTISMRVRRQKDTSMTPSLWFELDGNELEGRIAVVDQQWHTLRWSFQATSISHHLELLGRDGTEQAGGDISFDDICIYPTTITENLDGQNTQLIDPGQSIQLPTMTITLLQGHTGIKAGIADYPHTIDGLLEGLAIVLQRGQSNPSSAQRLRIDLTVPCDKIKFAWTWRQRPGEVEFHDERGQLLETLSFSGEPRHHWVEYQAPAERRIASLVVTSRDYAFLDFFTFTSA